MNAAAVTYAFSPGNSVKPQLAFWTQARERVVKWLLCAQVSACHNSKPTAQNITHVNIAYMSADYQVSVV